MNTKLKPCVKSTCMTKLEHYLLCKMTISTTCHICTLKTTGYLNSGLVIFKANVIQLLSFRPIQIPNGGQA